MHHVTIRSAIIPTLRTLATLATLAIVVSFAACGSSLGPSRTLDTPVVDVAATTVAPGAIVAMRARNLSATSWYYNACSSPRLQRREGAEWVDTPDPLMLCSAELQTLGGGAVLSIGVGVPMGFEGGTYRIVFRVSRRDGVDAAPTTNSFEVR